MERPVVETNFEGLPLLHRGKVRDIYDLGDTLLIVTTDRISAFDVILPDPVPDKGKVLTQISLYWFEIMADQVANHLVSADVEAFPEVCRPHADTLRGRSMLVRKAQTLPIECVVRGYISGSGWKSYRESGTVCGISLPAGLRESDRLPEPLFTPSTKAELGEHDVNIDFEETAVRVGRKTAETVRDLSLEIYRRGAEMAAEKGIIIADTKFEFGTVDGEIVLIDEVLTPDSSRFWPRDSYRPGGAQQSFDKQYVRDYLRTLDWNRSAPGPHLPDRVVRNTRSKYLEAYRQLTGKEDGI